MITDQALTNRRKSGGNGQEPTNMQRRIFMGGALAALLSSSKPLMAQGNAVPTDPNAVPRDPFIVLLRDSTSPCPRVRDLTTTSACPQ